MPILAALVSVSEKFVAMRMKATIVLTMHSTLLSHVWLLETDLAVGSFQSSRLVGKSSYCKRCGSRNLSFAALVIAGRSDSANELGACALSWLSSRCSDSGYVLRKCWSMMDSGLSSSLSLLPRIVTGERKPWCSALDLGPLNSEWYVRGAQSKVLRSWHLTQYGITRPPMPAQPILWKLVKSKLFALSKSGSRSWLSKEVTSVYVFYSAGVFCKKSK